MLLVRGGTRADVLRLLGAEAESSGEPFPDLEDIDYSGYALVEVEGGVVAFELTGYADPSPRVLAALSALRGAAAVTRFNVMAHERFGCARDGVIVFDADEFMYVTEQEKEGVPPELRPMFDSAGANLDRRRRRRRGRAWLRQLGDGGHAYRRRGHRRGPDPCCAARLPSGADAHLPRVTLGRE